MKVDFNLIPTNRRSAFLCFCFACLLFSFGCSRRSAPETFEELEVYPAIYPDYVETTLPFNVAPANFRIEVEAQKYVETVLSEIKEAAGKVLASGGNAYSLGYADAIVTAPTESRHYYSGKAMAPSS